MIPPHADAPESADGALVQGWVRFAAVLRRVGIDVTPDQIAAAIEACTVLGLRRRTDVRDGTRAILVGRHALRERYDRAFDAFWRAETAQRHPRVDLGRRVTRGTQRSRRVVAAKEAPSPSPNANPTAEVEHPQHEPRFTWSDREALRRKDFAALDADERRVVLSMLHEQPLALAPRRTRRRKVAPRGTDLDLRRTMRTALRYGGDPLVLAWRRRRERPRPLVLLCDISGSMEPYTRIFLQLLYASARRTDTAEAFVFGTRLTRITRELRHRDVDEALRRAAAAVVDWGGGTRIGEALRHFNQVWGRRVLGRGAVVVVISDGWDRGEPEALGDATARLRRTCHRLIWLNPLLGSPGYEPQTRGILAVLPQIDDFLPIHDLRSVEALAEHLARLAPRRGERAAGRPTAVADRL